MVMMNKGALILLLLPRVEPRRGRSAQGTDVKGVVTLLVNARWSISNAMEVGFTRGMASVASTLKHHMQDCFSARF
jgi:hypothetical protein